MSRDALCDLDCAWIAPDGTATHLDSSKTGWASHCGVAEQLGDRSGGRGLDNQGYVHLSYGDPFMGHPGMEPTQAQLNALADIAVKLRKHGAWRGEYIQKFLKAQHEKETA